MHKILISLLIFVFSCNNADKQKEQLQQIKKHVNIQNDSVGELIRIDSFNSEIKKQVNKDPDSSTIKAK